MLDDKDPFGLATLFALQSQEELVVDIYEHKEIDDPLFEGKLSNLTPYLFYGIEQKFPNVVLAGGALRGLIGGEDTLSDFDLYFLEQDGVNTEALVGDVAIYLIRNHGFEIEVDVEGLTTLTNGEHKIQLSRMNSAYSLEGIIDGFDINAGRIAYHQGKVVYVLQALEDNINRKITFNKLRHPASNLLRIVKYTKKGYELEKAACVQFVNLLLSMGSEGEEIKMFPFSVES